jgi:hypothetical protein
MKAHIKGALCAGLFSLGLVSTANAGLFPITAGPLDGLAVYDDVLDITWLADANAGAGTAFDNGVSTTDGKMTWTNAGNWAANLTTGGATDWRLPSMDVNGDDTIVDCSSAPELACRDNEYGYLLHQYGISESSQSPFTNVFGNFWRFDMTGVM